MWQAATMFLHRTFPAEGHRWHSHVYASSRDDHVMLSCIWGTVKTTVQGICL